MDRKAADGLKVKVERVISARIVGNGVDDETARWLNAAWTT